jgi:hypothetical protein
VAKSYVPSASQAAPPAALRARVEALVGESSLTWSKPDTGLSAAHRFLVAFESGRSAFIKAATTPQTAALLRNEHLALLTAPRRFTPRVLAWTDGDDAFPLLIAENLVDGHWPASHAGVHWRAGDIERVIAAIRALSEITAPEALPCETSERAAGWPMILAAPGFMTGLGLCSSAWLDAHGEELARAESRLIRKGNAFVHGDMRSDNICLTDDRVIFVDWSEARRGAAATDLAMFLPAARLEGGPAPQGILPDGGPWAAAECAELALRARDDIAAPAWLARVLRRLAWINLDWAVKEPMPVRAGG